MPDPERVDPQSLRGRLQRLPEAQPPLLLARRAIARHRARRRAWRAAAAMIVAVGVGSWFAIQRPAAEVESASAEAAVGVENAAAGPTVEVLASLDKNELISASGLFESALVRRRSGPKSLSATNAARIASLEDRLAVIDFALAATPARSDESVERQLWLGRLRTLDDMMTTYEDQDRENDSLVLASF